MQTLYDSDTYSVTHMLANAVATDTPAGAQTRSADAGLPKPTLVRLLQALIADEYVIHVSRTAGYRLAARVRALMAKPACLSYRAGCRQPT